MLYMIYLQASKSGTLTSMLNLFGYITFRAGFAAMLGILLTLLLGGPMIRLLHRAGIHDTPRDYGVMRTTDKRGTPQMGGLIFAFVTLVVVLLTCNLNSRFVQLLLLALIWFTALGAADDYLKMGMARVKKIKLPEAYKVETLSKKILVIGGGVTGLS